jgi:hypothetical protein
MPAIGSHDRDLPAVRYGPLGLVGEERTEERPGLGE